jgi:hypothetical protein
MRPTKVFYDDQFFDKHNEPYSKDRKPRRSQDGKYFKSEDKNGKSFSNLLDNLKHIISQEKLDEDNDLIELNFGKYFRSYEENLFKTIGKAKYNL